MKAIFAGLLAIGMLGSAGQVSASGTTTAGVLNYVNIGGGWAYARGAGMSGNPDSCPNTGTYLLSSTNTNYKEILATILTGRATGVQMTFFVNGCGGPHATNKFPLIFSATMK